MAVPGMMIPPIAMSFLEKSAAFIKNPWLKAPTTVTATAIASNLHRVSLSLFSFFCSYLTAHDISPL